MPQSLRERANDVLNNVIGGIILAILLGGVVLGIISGVGITLWARFSELSAAIVTALALAAAALIVALVNLALTVRDKWSERNQGDQVSVSRTSLGTSTAEVRSDGILWRHNGVWQGSLPHKEAFCPDHRMPLMGWSSHTDDFFDALTSAEIDFERGDELWCRGRVDSERHALKLTESTSWKQAVALANVRIKAKVVENDSYKRV